MGINFQENRFCAGVVLNENHVLTAGSCVLNANRHLVAANQVQIRAGKFHFYVCFRLNFLSLQFSLFRKCPANEWGSENQCY